MKLKYAVCALVLSLTLPSTGFAADATQSITNENADTPVQINGTINANKGTRLSVTMPTSIAFMIDDAGNFTGTNLNVENKSNSPVRITVSSFVQASSNQGTVLKSYTDVSNNRDTISRTHLALILEGSLLSDSERNNTVVDLYEIEQKQIQPTFKPYPLLDLEQNSSGVIKLDGKAGTKASVVSSIESNGFNPSYTVQFRVARITN
jgi:hypothetical protein